MLIARRHTQPALGNTRLTAASRFLVYARGSQCYVQVGSTYTVREWGRGLRHVRCKSAVHSPDICMGVLQLLVSKSAAVHINYVPAHVHVATYIHMGANMHYIANIHNQNTELGSPSVGIRSCRVCREAGAQTRGLGAGRWRG